MGILISCSFQICDQKFLHFTCTCCFGSICLFIFLICTKIHWNYFLLLSQSQLFLSIFLLCGPRKHSVILSSHLLRYSQDLTIKFIAVQITFSAHGKNKLFFYSRRDFAQFSAFKYLKVSQAIGKQPFILPFNSELWLEMMLNNLTLLRKVSVWGQRGNYKYSSFSYFFVLQS